MPTRLAHVRGVAAAAERAASVLSVEDAETVVAAAWLHDVGYAPSVRRTGFHPVDGATFLHDLAFPDMVVSLVAYHTGAATEAAERGLDADLALITAPRDDLLDVLTYADMTTGPDGESISAEERLAEILRRHAPEDPVHVAVTRSRPDLLAAADRTRWRLTAARASQPR